MLWEKDLSWCPTSIVILRRRRRLRWKQKRSLPKSGPKSALDEASSYGDHHRMGAVICVQLGKDAAHVPFDRILRNYQAVGDYLVGATFSDHAQHFNLARRQSVRTQVTGQF